MELLYSLNEVKKIPFLLFLVSEAEGKKIRF